MLQNGVWTDYADHTRVDTRDGKATVALRDGGEGDEAGTTDGVIEQQSGPSTTSTTRRPPPLRSADDRRDGDGGAGDGSAGDMVPVTKRRRMTAMASPSRSRTRRRTAATATRDGLVDSRQANVASLPAAVDVNGNGALDDYVTIVSPEGTTLTNVRALQVPSDNPPPDGVSLPYGLFEYDVTVANPGDTADVTYVLPDADVAPTSVHMLQNGVWTDYADHTSVDAVDGKVTVTFRDGGEGDATGTADGVIEDPSGPSTSNQTITVTNASGAAAPNFTFRLELCTETTGTTCTGATPVGTASGSNNAAGDSAALANGASWFWGSHNGAPVRPQLPPLRDHTAPGLGMGPDRPRLQSGRNLDDERRYDRDRHAPERLDWQPTRNLHLHVRDSQRNDHRPQGRHPRDSAGTDNGTNYANGLQGAVFESSPQGANTWSDLCTTNADRGLHVGRPVAWHLRRAREERTRGLDHHLPVGLRWQLEPERATRPTRTSVPPPSAPRARRTSRCSARTPRAPLMRTTGSSTCATTMRCRRASVGSRSRWCSTARAPSHRQPAGVHRRGERRAG